jgi:hypothetical protein
MSLNIARPAWASAATSPTPICSSRSAASRWREGREELRHSARAAWHRLRGQSRPISR